MPYPWPSFDDFVFARSEGPILGSDTGWQPQPNIGQAPILGGLTSSPIMLGLVSDRSFECYMTPARVAELRAWLGVRGTFTDWERPTPASRAAMIVDAAFQEQDIGVRAGETHVRQLTRLRVSLVGL